MTTAARATFEPARGGQGRGEKDLSALSRQYSSRDLPSHMKLKFREVGQGTSEELRSRNYRQDLQDREARAGSVARSSSSGPAKRARLQVAPASSLDADDADEEDSDDEMDSDEENEAMLMAELLRIKRERAVEMAKQIAEKQREAERIRTDNILRGNPLMNMVISPADGDKTVRRRWDEDVVFKNCDRGHSEGRKPFINDSLRSEFHRKFMEKYIK